MSVSKGDRDYWVRFLQSAIQTKVNFLDAQGGGVLKLAQELARIQVHEDTNTTEMVDEIEKLEAAKKRLDQQKSAIDEQMANIHTAIYVAITGEQDTSHYHARDGFWWKDRVKQLVKARTPEMLETLRNGPEILALQKQAKNIELQIRFATSPTALTAFAKEALVSLGLDKEYKLEL